ncbi:Mitochondrial fission regulator 2-like [Homarus americanus]|uniref:Mitochondrial fission regulator 2-like n=1 Tax=Homarus americanus TaxID=6706 RepID=A0A8J5TLF6_HOMAM|nr:Mitochondrial fission regulator 2-like [Homarus americanus]
MDRMSGIWAVLVGVVEELWLDIGDGLWVVLEAVGLGRLVLRLREEIISSVSRPRRRSWIRIIGSALPLKPVERPYLRYVALRSLSTSCDSLFSAHTQGRIDSKWLADTERSSRFRPLLSRCETAPELFPLGRDVDRNINGDATPRSSTPFSIASDIGPPHHCIHNSEDNFVARQQHENLPHNSFHHSTIHAASPFTDPSALAKISALEDELSLLRSQISIILNQTKRPVTPPSSPTPSTPVPPPPPPPPSCLPPPPPAPPLPAIWKKSSLPTSTQDPNLLRKPSFSEMIAQNKDNINKHTEDLNVPANENGISRPVSMTDVLKGLNKVKLKKVSRSPGGTPVRSRPKSPAPNDPAAIIAAALKKRFANMHSDSPEKEANEESNEYDSSPDTTPQLDRRSRIEIPKRKILQEETPTQNLFKMLKKPSPRIQKPKPKPREVEKSSLPIFGQHLLKKRVPQAPEPRESVSPCSEASDLSR